MGARQEIRRGLCLATILHLDNDLKLVVQSRLVTRGMSADRRMIKSWSRIAVAKIGCPPKTDQVSPMPEGEFLTEIEFP